MWNISFKVNIYQKLKICTVEMDLQTTEWGASWYCYFTPFFAYMYFSQIHNGYTKNIRWTD